MQKNYATQFLGKQVEIVVDRPLWTKHPHHNYFYSFNYGYIPHTLAPDEKEVDAYILGVFKPIEHFTGFCIAVIHRFDDEDDKCIIVPEGKDYSDAEIRVLIEFQERFFQSEIIR